MEKMPEFIASAPFALDQAKHRPSQDYHRVYSNNATFSLSFFDVSMTFGEIAFDAFGEPPYVLDGATVSMSWEHAKALHAALGSMIANYEASQGVKIREP